LGRPSNLRLSTRILLLQHEPQPGASRPLGIIAEHATELVPKQLGDFTLAGDALVAADPRGRLRLLQLEKLLTDELRDLIAVFHLTQSLNADAV
jgi:hypothetical protein